ncbi:MAG TPA: NAD(P)H-binding protein [Thermoanaerobaculia bacterium]|nr:NAD(P)H-binding protein [Thermoanaerobaculia bacterium]
MSQRSVFVTGGTGYLGRRLIPELLARGYRVKALVRPGSEARIPPGAEAIPGNALDAASFADQVPADCIFVQLVGVAKPSPAKARQFREIDLASALASIEVAKEARVTHFVYLSVAMPAPAMRAYVAARAEAEERLRASGLPATILRPWYVLGPGHRWPYALLPLYWLWEALPSTRATARRLGLVTLRQMVTALAEAVDHPPKSGARVVEVPEIRRAG